ncbi:MAG: type II toxin-antitoxin system VapC family toxin [Acidimicrobiales bacterium]
MDCAGESLLDSWRPRTARRYLATSRADRYPAHSLLEPVWELRGNLPVYGASYVAVAELLDCALVTADGRLARAPGIASPVAVLPR